MHILQNSSLVSNPNTECSSPTPHECPANSLDETGGTPLRYVLQNHLGTGTSGSVYCAWDSKLGQKVALKMLNVSALSEQHLLLREVKLARDLRHPGIVGIHDLADYNGQPCISMEYVDGVTLRDVLVVDKRIPDDRLVNWAVQICSALACAHKNRIVHCDLKPENVLLDNTDRIRLTDFGLAIHLHSYSLDGRCGGTPLYMSPEQRQGLPVDARTDIYSMGLILFEATVGRRATAAEMDRGAAIALNKSLKHAPRFSEASDHKISCVFCERPISIGRRGDA